MHREYAAPRVAGAAPRKHTGTATWCTLFVGGILMFLSSCSAPRPSGLLGLRWGQRASEAPAQIGLQCPDWQPWPNMAPFEVCHGGPVSALGHEAALVTFVRREDVLAGIQLVFKQCTEHGDALRKELAGALKLDGEALDYRTWQSGEVVRMEARGNECVVTVTNAELGKAYQKHRMGQRPLFDPR